MEKPIESYWDKRLEALSIELESNNFEVFIAKSSADAKTMVTEQIIPEMGVKSISWGGSLSFVETGIYNALKDSENYDILDVYDKKFTPEEILERRRQALLSDLFITGTNAITEDGYLVNLDMIGNRVAGLTFGPKNVIIIVGRNKIVCDLTDAMYRIKNFVAPVNVMRLGMKTPCSKTSTCADCNSPQRICNTWTITEKSFPKGRIRIVLVNEDLGF